MSQLSPRFINWDILSTFHTMGFCSVGFCLTNGILSCILSPIRLNARLLPTQSTLSNNKNMTMCHHCIIYVPTVCTHHYAIVWTPCQQPSCREFYFCSRFPRSHYLVWWVRVKVSIWGRVSKLLGSNYNPKPSI